MGFLERIFRGDAVSDADYGAQEAAEDKEEEESALDGTYARPAQRAVSPRKDNVVEFARPRASAGADSGGGFTRGTAEFAKESAGFTTREFGGGSGGGFGGGGFGGTPMSETGETSVVFKRLKDFTAASQVADKMTEQKIVILNLESCDDEVARRILDFLGGVAYACSSMVKRIAGRVFMITPKGISSDGEFFDEARAADTASINYDD